ncbi:LOW QUALITY PROTEIN: mutS protein homolog 5-like [Pomacea canaliculata]|uniref:LOW QUALITY PROTEIN: mutS protein homolog 5-like n=1 Tax=Pomacea canaliculata TaxID=400727 RepID=UPI000D733747|nr:LOW QUALITY PROTEIN: mutS protein homolog 5-like [Pomacea canaliculata]
MSVIEGADQGTGFKCNKENDESISADDQQRCISFPQSQTDGSSGQPEVFLSLVWHGYKLGVAYYEVDCPKVNFMPDCPEKEDLELLQQVLKQVQPSCVILSSKQDERLLKVLKKTVSEGGDLDDDAENILHFLPNGDFGLEVSKRRILSLTLPGLHSHSTETERALYFSSIMPADNVCVVRAIGGLLKYLNQARVGVELEDTNVRVPILGFCMFTVEDQIIMDNITYSALQIFHKEAHPSVYKVGTTNSCKEGLSLFGILNRCRSQIGSKKLRQWFFRPLKNLTTIRHRLDAISFFTQLCNMEAVNSLQACLKEIKNVPRILARMIQAQVMPVDWMALYKTVYHAVYIRDICRAQVQQVDIFRKIGKKFTDDLHKVANLLSKTVDFDASVTQNRFVVRPGLDRVLDEKKRLYHGLPDLMTKVAREELSRLGENVTACNVIYMPQICYLLAIPKAEGLINEEDFTMPGLQFMFESNGVLHYKSARTKELDAMLGDTLCEIKDMETSIMHRLQNAIVDSSQVLLDVMEYAAELDCLLALAACAQEFGYVCPELTEECIIDVKKGRHPLQELCCSPYVPNNVQSGGGHAKVKILTGPNACGKSVYLKQVALIVYMAHIGSFVPAESAVIGEVDRIFSRIKSLESVSVGLSTFMLDLNQMSDALNNATKWSLVVIDEFGKGTETIDGLSLLCASLRHWLKKGDKCPHTFVSTHFHIMAQQPFLPLSPELEFLTMETLQESGELVFLFQLTQGHTSSSYAAHTALQAGLPPEIIKRGQEVSKLLCQYKPVHPVDDKSSRVYLERCMKIVERFLNLDLQKDDVENFLQNFVLPLNRGENIG